MEGSERRGDNIVDGQVDDYFTVDKEKEVKSSEDSYLVSGPITRNQQKKEETRRKSIFPESNDGSDDEDDTQNIFNQQRSDSGMLAGIALSKGYFGKDSDDDI